MSLINLYHSSVLAGAFVLTWSSGLTHPNTGVHIVTCMLLSIIMVRENVRRASGKNLTCRAESKI